MIENSTPGRESRRKSRMKKERKVIKGERERSLDPMVLRVLCRMSFILFKVSHVAFLLVSYFL